MRKVAKNDFEKDFYKLMNNAVFGKFMENVRNRVSIKFFTSVDKTKKYINKPNCKAWRAFNDNVCAVEMLKKEVCMNKPLIIAIAVLDLSKYLMY
ncbi:MAG: hypothetical protein ACK4IX_18380, partial [Candidatus Sericytochromatia bacterium]